MLAVFPAVAQQVGDKPATAAQLPDLGGDKRPAPAANTSITPRPNGVSVSGGGLDSRFLLSPEYSNQTGFAVSAALAGMIGEHAAIGVILTGGDDKREALINAGFRLDEQQRFLLSVGQLKQFLDFAFRSGTEKTAVTQNSGGLGYQLQLGSEFLRYLEVNGYVAKTASRDLADKTFAVNTATLFELWNDPRRIAGGTVSGLQGSLAFSPLTGSTVKVSLGGERLSYDLANGKDSTSRLTGGIEWEQQLSSGIRLKAGAESFASQNRYSLGIERSLGSSSDGRHSLGLSLAAVRGRDHLGNDNQVKLNYSYAFGSGSAGSAAKPAVRANSNAAPPVQTPGTASPLLDQVLLRPSYMPSRVIAKVDTSIQSTRLIAIDKTTLPAGASIVTATGDVSLPLGVNVTGIAGVTKNAVAFANGGQFALSGATALLIHTGLITQPAVGVTDTYVVTINNQGGGTTVVTIVISHGSVRIDSITIGAGGPDVTPPVTTVAPTISIAATDTTASVTQTINETGTGYYLVQAAAAAAPSVAAVKAGTAFAMTAGTPAVVSLTGLTASTAYKYYFVAKDAANNDQAAVSAALAITTTAAADITAPTTTAAPSVSGTTSNSTTLSVTINENGTGYYLVQAAAAAAPSAAAVMAGTSFAMTANVAATPAISGLNAGTAYKIYFVAKDAANNAQAAVQSVAVTTSALPAGYVVQGGLTWMPNNIGPWGLGKTNWNTANTYCTTATINGQTGWRLPTKDELVSLYNSGAMNAQGWTLYNTWSSAPYAAGDHYTVNLNTGTVGWSNDPNSYYVSCVR